MTLRTHLLRAVFVLSSIVTITAVIFYINFRSSDNPTNKSSEISIQVAANDVLVSSGFVVRLSDGTRTVFNTPDRVARMKSGNEIRIINSAIYQRDPEKFDSFIHMNGDGQAHIREFIKPVKLVANSQTVAKKGNTETFKAMDDTGQSIQGKAKVVKGELAEIVLERNGHSVKYSFESIGVASRIEVPSQGQIADLSPGGSICDPFGNPPPGEATCISF